VVPEYVANSAAALAQANAQGWWPVYLRLRRPKEMSVVMVRRSPRSFVIVFPVSANEAGRRTP
jgi:hypothetical protein